MKIIKLLKGRWQRTINSIAIWIVLSVSLANQSGLLNLGNQVNQLERQLVREQEEISQLVVDEGYRRCSYSDSLDKGTIGFGHLIVKGDNFERCLTPSEAINLLRSDYNMAKQSVNNSYPWAIGEVKLVLINMTYQIGENGVSKFGKAISAMRNKKYDKAASEMLTSLWAKQTQSRAAKLAGRIMNLKTI